MHVFAFWQFPYLPFLLCCRILFPSSSRALGVCLLLWLLPWIQINKCRYFSAYRSVSRYFQPRIYCSPSAAALGGALEYSCVNLNTRFSDGLRRALQSHYNQTSPKCIEARNCQHHLDRWLPLLYVSACKRVPGCLCHNPWNFCSASCFSRSTTCAFSLSIWRCKSWISFTRCWRRSSTATCTHCHGDMCIRMRHIQWVPCKPAKVSLRYFEQPVSVSPPLQNSAAAGSQRLRSRTSAHEVSSIYCDQALLATNCLRHHGDSNNLDRLLRHGMLHCVASLVKKWCCSCNKKSVTNSYLYDSWVVLHFKSSKSLNRDSQISQVPQWQNPNPWVEISLQNAISSTSK